MATLVTVAITLRVILDRDHHTECDDYFGDSSYHAPHDFR